MGRTEDLGERDFMNPIVDFVARYEGRWRSETSLGRAEPQLRSLPTTAAVQCADTRPEICTLDYRPVCAPRDTGVRCVTTPCDSTELATYSNACAACADPRVVSSTEGACESLE